MCGEQSAPARGCPEAGGSPPRVRGTVLSELQEPRLSGITPACAGNSSSAASSTSPSQDHPRVCGEQMTSRGCPRGCAGSPPRVRGTVRRLKKKLIICRITPACAGNSARTPWQLFGNQDHPRVCGEQIKGRFEERENEGSPPRVRGTGNFSAADARPIGITPACAGNRDRTGTPTRGTKDHPRVCGEQHLVMRCQLKGLGSPPRVRGTDTVKGGSVAEIGITPACAGNRYPYADE